MANHVTVSDAMNTKPISVSAEMVVSECAKIMRAHDIGSVIVERDGKLLGFLTEQGIVHKIVARGKNPTSTTVGEVMLVDVATIAPDVALNDAMSLMARMRIRQLPVVVDGSLIGLLTQSDVLKIQPALIDMLAQRYSFSQEGYCEECGSRTHVSYDDGRMLCDVCR